VVFDILDVGLEIALLMKIIRGQGLKEFLEAFRVVLMAAMVALLLSLGGSLMISDFRPLS